jgi:NADH dehydrogenase FAD-containing subunit
MKPRILILGGGVGDLVSVNKLAKIFKDQAEITLIIYAQLPLGGDGL